MNNLAVIERENQRVMTTAVLAEEYGTTVQSVSNNYNRNKERYIEGKHFYCLEGEQLKEFKANHQFDEQLKFATKLYLWTEKGALLHAKSLGTDRAWEVYEMLVENYFRKQATPQLSGLSPLLQVCINLETAQQQQQSVIENMDKRIGGIEMKLTPKKQAKTVPMQTELTFQEEFYSRTLKKDRVSTERIVAMYSLSAKAFYLQLQKLGLVVPSEKKGWLLHEDYKGEGVGFNQPCSGSGYNFVKWSEKGLKVITRMLEENGVVAVKRLPQRKKTK